MAPALTDYYDFRERIVDAVRRDLVGPRAGVEEILSDAPITAYLVGALYPQIEEGAETIAPEEDLEPEEADDEVVPADPPIAMANMRYPSSMGLTFAVDRSKATEVEVEISTALYAAEVTDEGTAWRRRPVTFGQRRVDVSSPSTEQEELGEGLELYTRVREPDAEGAVAVTLALINTRAAQAWEKDADTFFQPRIEVRGAAGAAPFVERRGGPTVQGDADIESYRLIFRHAKAFAAGHGCSVEWETDESGDFAHAVRSEFFPTHAVPVAESNPAVEVPMLSMRRLAEDVKDEVLKGLGELCDGYEAWIKGEQEKASGLPEDLAEVAGRHVEECEGVLARMRSGIAVLADDDQAWTAFRLANKAMLAQRARAEWIEAGADSGGPHEDDSHRWRPFQLAFILLCIRGIVEPHHDDRSKADLLWFPSGGGKTEAYLGLIAFTVFLRRLRNGVHGAGIAAIMRYTLRLLTIQQFQRAALLICACEALRRERDDLGDEEMSLGLWIGHDGSPNDLAGARRALDRLGSGQPVEKGSPIQLHSCPWCGTRLTPRNYWIADNVRRLMISCRNDRCDFGASGLPVYVVDEDVYSRKPSLVISTVDKFANLPWRESVADMFNLDEDSPPPELIVQDELHLISGPLGTLMGLYETAIDFLCTDAGVRPKVIASTATIRRAEQQLEKLFDREMAQFPPQGTDSRDSYFAVEASAERKGTRLYGGLMAPGTSQTTLMVRVYAALLQAAADLDAPDPAVRDPYWTLVGYFNSLRVLGGARMQVQDDVVDRLELISENGARPIPRRVELTSREPSAAIPDRLRDMSVSHPDEDALDVILATNMISVGMDIDRLGLMVVMGQPQATAEYIQATSRVGRQFPGLILTLFNAARSRDRSHYESFVAYHSALYRQVESSSVTPFAPRSRDRALHALLVGLARLTIPELRPNEGAALIADAEVEKRVRALGGEIGARVESIDQPEAEHVSAELDAIVSAWRQRAEDQPGLVFANRTHPDRALLVQAGEESTADPAQLPTLTSLRDVDVESDLFLVA
jgi:hypothetical protein